MLFKYWDDQCVIYDTLSANTHLLKSSSAKILELMLNHHNTEDLIQNIREEKSLQLYYAYTDKDLINLIKSYTTQFKTLQLIV